MSVKSDGLVVSSAVGVYVGGRSRVGRRLGRWGTNGGGGLGAAFSALP